MLSYIKVLFFMVNGDPWDWGHEPARREIDNGPEEDSLFLQEPELPTLPEPWSWSSMSWFRAVGAALELTWRLVLFQADILLCGGKTLFQLPIRGRILLVFGQTALAQRSRALGDTLEYLAPV